MKNVVTFPTANARLRNSPSGIIGAGARRSHPTKASSSTPPASSVPTVGGLDHPASFARTRAQTRATTPAVTRTTPTRSSGSGAPWLSGSSHRPSVTASSPIGTLSQKIQCQSRLSVTAPPTSGPDATAKPARPP